MLASFDVVPSAKGAARHILRNAELLREAGHEVSLVTLGREPAPGYRHRPIPIEEPNWLRRALAFREAVARVFELYPFDVYHVRSPWEGLAVPAGERLVVEINGVPSVEAIYHHAALIERPALQAKLRVLEDALLDRAALVITPSEVTRDYLADRGVPAERIAVVPNAPSFAPAAAPPARGAAAGEPVRLCYAGTLTRWQGLEELLSAMGRAGVEVTLTVLTPSSASRQRALLRAAAKAGVAERVTFSPPLEPEALGAFLATQDVGVAPLLPCARNLVQGGMPLKILDTMAAGLPVLAPDLPIVQRILGPGYPTYPRHSVAGMAELLAALSASPELRRELGARGLGRVRAELSREAQAIALRAAYASIAA